MLGTTLVTLARPWPMQVIVDSVLGSRPAPDWVRAAGHLDRYALLGLAVTLLVVAILCGHLLALAQEFCMQVLGQRMVLSVAKHGYVVSRSGWFSERSATYLASGRPVVAEDTGFTRWLAAGNGVVAFAGPDEALAGIEAIHARDAEHCRAAREIAAAYFDARAVLARLVSEALAPAARATAPAPPKAAPRSS